MKKLLAILMMSLMLLGCLSSLAVSHAETYVYLTGSENVHTGPGLGYTTIGSAHKGSSLPYLGSSSVDERGVTWYLVSFSNTTGWISGKYGYLTGSGGSTYYGSGANGGSSGGYSGGGYSGGAYVVATGNVNLHTGPGLSYTDVGTLHTGETAPYLGNSSYDSRGVLFYQINYNGMTCWVSSIYTNLMGGYSGGGYSGGGYSGGYVYATGNVNLHTGPGLNYTDVGTLHKGETAAYLGNSSYDSRGVLFYQINYYGTVCWVSSIYAELHY